jgi:peptide/nickel transport system substrate-binding protein
MASRSVSRRQFLTLAGSTAAFSVLAACGATPTATPVPTKPPAATATTAKPVATATPSAPADMAADQTLRYVTRGFARIDPASEAGFERWFIAHMFMPFFLRDENSTLMPWLGTSWEVNGDFTEYTVHINPKAVWSDGTPVKAQEAKEYLTYGLSKACVTCLQAVTSFKGIAGAAEVIAGTATELTGVTAKDDKTVVFKLAAPDPIFIQALALFDSGFCKMEDVNKYPVKLPSGTTAFNANNLTRVNGPFMVSKWDLDTKEYELVQNPKWWGDKKPYITKITATEAADENVSFIQWKNDEVDAVQWLTNIREQIRKDQASTFNKIPYPTNFHYYMVADIPPLDDINVRKALVHAVDWNAAIAAAWEGARNDRVMTTALTPEMPCYKKGNWPEFGYDPAKAKSELAASKYGTPDKLGKIRITPNGQSANYIRVAEIMMEQWKNNLGITDVEMKPGGLDVWGQDSTKVQFIRMSKGATIPDAAFFISTHYATYQTYTKVTKHTNAALETLLAQVNKLKRDDPTYCSLAQQAEALFLGDYLLAPMIWDLYEYNTKPWVKNFKVNIDNNWYNLLNMYIAKH